MNRLRTTARPDTVAVLPAEDIVILSAGTLWQVPWELMVAGPFSSCGLLDGEHIRHLTVSSMIASAVRRRSEPDVVLTPIDYQVLPVFAAEMTLQDAALLVVDNGWELAVVMDREPRVISARSVYRSLASRPPQASGARSSADCWTKKVAFGYSGRATSKGIDRMCPGS